MHHFIEALYMQAAFKDFRLLFPSFEIRFPKFFCLYHFVIDIQRLEWVGKITPTYPECNAART